MTREIRARSSPSVAGWTLAVSISGALSYAQQPNIAIPPTPANIQALPNMGQQITPLAPQGSRFEPMNPGLADNPDWLAGQDLRQNRVELLERYRRSLKQKTAPALKAAN
jgi:hypothetical protein